MKKPLRLGQQEKIPFVLEFESVFELSVLAARDELTLLESAPREASPALQSGYGTLITRVKNETTDNE